MIKHLSKNRFIPKWNAAKFLNISAMDVIICASPKIDIVHSDMKKFIAHIN